MTSRLHCCVPGCRRTTKPQRFDEWICQPHWSAVPVRDRRLYAAAKRRASRRGGHEWARVAARLWVRCRRAAIEIAMGIR